MSGKRKLVDRDSSGEEHYENGIRSVLRLLEKEIISRERENKNECQELKRRNERLSNEILDAKKEIEQLRKETSGLKDKLCTKDSEIWQLKNKVELTRKLCVGNKVAKVRLDKQLASTSAVNSSDSEAIDDIDSDSDNSVDSVFTEGAETDPETRANIDTLLSLCNEEAVATDVSSSTKKSKVKRKVTSGSPRHLKCENSGAKYPQTSSTLQSSEAPKETEEIPNPSNSNSRDNDDSDLEVVFETNMNTGCRDQVVVSDRIHKDDTNVAIVRRFESRNTTMLRISTANTAPVCSSASDSSNAKGDTVLPKDNSNQVVV